MGVWAGCRTGWRDSAGGEGAAVGGIGVGRRSGVEGRRTAVVPCEDSEMPLVAAVAVVGTGR